MVTRRIHITTTKNNLLQFHIACMLYSHLRIYEQMRDLFLYLQTNIFPVEIYNGCKVSKILMPRTLSVIMIYKEGKMVKYLVLASLTFASYLNYVTCEYLYICVAPKNG